MKKRVDNMCVRVLGYVGEGDILHEGHVKGRGDKEGAYWEGGGQ